MCCGGMKRISVQCMLPISLNICQSNVISSPNIRYSDDDMLSIRAMRARRADIKTRNNVVSPECSMFTLSLLTNRGLCEVKSLLSLHGCCRAHRIAACLKLYTFFIYMCRSWVNRHRHCYLNKGVAQAKSSNPTFIQTWKQTFIFSITLAWSLWLVERGSATSHFHAAVPQCAMFFFRFWIHTIFWASQHFLPFVVRSSMKSKFLNTISIAQFVVDNSIWMCLYASSNATDWALNEKCENAVCIVTWKSLHIYFHKASKLLANVNIPQHNSCRWRLAKRKIIQFPARTLF